MKWTHLNAKVAALASFSIYNDLAFFLILRHLETSIFLSLFVIEGGRKISPPGRFVKGFKIQEKNSKNTLKKISLFCYTRHRLSRSIYIATMMAWEGKIPVLICITKMN